MATLTTSWQYLGQQYIGTSGGNLYVRLYARYSEQDIANNRSYVFYQARSYYENSTYIQDGQGTIGVSGTGANYNSAGCTYVTTGESVTVETSGWVSHNNDGSCSVSGSATINFPNWGWSGTASASADLPTIPRASDIACSSPYIGDTTTITIDKKNSSYVNTVTYEIGSLTGTIAQFTDKTVLSLSTSSLEDQIYALIPNEREIQGKVYCTTYRRALIGYIKVGDTKSVTFNLYAKENVCKPNVTATIIDTNENTIAITEDNTKFIKYISKPKVTVNATAKKSSTIKSYSINLNDGQVSNLQENTFDTIGSNRVTVSAVDSRNYSASYEMDLTDKMIDYIKLHIDSISLERTEDISNEILLNMNGVFFNASFSSSSTNSLTAKFQYRKTGEIEWSELAEITPTIENNTFKFSDYSLGNIYGFDDEYQFKIILNDLLITVGNSDSDIITVPKGQEVIAIGEDSVWVYGDLFLNDKKINDVSFCKMNTSFEYKDFTSREIVKGWENEISIGDYVANTSLNSLEIENTELLQLSGKISGHNYGGCYYAVYEVGGESLTDKELGNTWTLTQQGGTGYWGLPLATVYIALDPTKKYRIQLIAEGYNNQTFEMNNGFGKYGTWICALKIK